MWTETWKIQCGPAPANTDPLRVLPAAPRRSGRKLNHKASGARVLAKIQKNTPERDLNPTCAISELGTEQLDRKDGIGWYAAGRQRTDTWFSHLAPN